MIAAPVTLPRAALAVLLGAVAVAALVVVFPPGAHDALPIRLAGTAAIDATYWSAPASRLAGAGGLEPYDHGLALSLALPQNALGVLAHALGAPIEVARAAGSLVAAFALGALAVLFGGRRGLALGVLLANPFVLGHLATDLAEPLALAVVAAWCLAVARGRLLAAAVLAGLGVFQKGCGLFLGVGCLAAVVCGGPGAGRRLARTAAGAAIGVAAAVLLAVGLFHDDALDFVLRPWRATADVRPVAAAASGRAALDRLVQLLFAGYHGAGPRLALPLAAAALLAPRSRPGAPATAALLAGLVFYGLFPDPQRLLPLVPLLLLPALEPEESGPPRGGLLFAAVLSTQAASAIVGAVGVRASAVALAVASVAVLVPLLAGGRRGSGRGAGLAATVLLAASAVVGPLALRGEPRLYATDLVDLSRIVARRVPAGGDLVAYAAVGHVFRGTIWYQDFEDQWTRQLDAARPRRLWRLRAEPLGAEPRPAPPGPAGYAPVGVPARLGVWPYHYDSSPVEVVLDELSRAP